MRLSFDGLMTRARLAIGRNPLERDMFLFAALEAKAQRKHLARLAAEEEAERRNSVKVYRIAATSVPRRERLP
jgi:hypothetical protein